MTKSESLKLLVYRLEQQEPAWDDVEEPLSQFPGWLTLVRALRYPVRPMDNRIVWGPVQSEYTLVSEKDRLRLLEFFRPFSILLDTDLMPPQRAEALKAAGTNPNVFCKEHRNDAIQEICESAAAVLQVLSADRTLLRWHRTPQNPEQLLRQAQDLKHESLLNPIDETAQSTPKPIRTHWFRRITRK